MRHENPSTSTTNEIETSTTMTNENSSEIDRSLNEYQKYLWEKHGKTMPNNWIDPFEIYD